MSDQAPANKRTHVLKQPVLRLTSPFKRQLERYHTNKRARSYRDNLRREATLGGQLFGPIPENKRREFVRLDETTWIWHEEWIDAQNIWHMNTVRYDIYKDGIYKLQEGQSYQPVTLEEARHLSTAVRLYETHVRSMPLCRTE